LHLPRSDDVALLHHHIEGDEQVEIEKRLTARTS
jgi:hypothetical protein